LFGALLFAITRNAQSLIFIALSPLLIVGNAIEQRIFGRRGHRKAVAKYRARLASLDGDLATRSREEIAARCREQPSASEVIDAAFLLRPLLWTRRADRHGFATVRLGLGRFPSRVVVEIKHRRDDTTELDAELDALVERYATVESVPAVADLRETGALGVAGPRDATIPLARGLVAQLVGLHSPADLSVSAIVGAAVVDDWRWLKWLPHTGSEHRPVTGALAETTAAASSLLSEIEALVERRRSDERTSSSRVAWHLLLVIVDEGVPIDRSRLVEVAEAGRSVGVHLLWVARSVEQLPAVCQTYVAVEAHASTATVGLVGEHARLTTIAVETIDHDTIEAFARALAPVIDAGAAVDESGSLPRSVSLLRLIDRAVARDPQAILDRWYESFSLPRAESGADDSIDRGLRSVVGLDAAQPLILDLRTQGPHALVGGTTGSGKSEFLQSWVVGLASAYSPARVTFLLVDYKGGSAFRECVDLPHTVGLVTDLTPHLVERALISLNAELRHRERLLEQKRAKDLAELERRGDPDAPPSLVIVVDEFAALVNEVPGFVDGVVNVAQRGRSLGLHLVLATQRPAGVIKDNLRANTNMRIALRMADADDSDNVVGSPLAATFDAEIPGRAVVKLGHGRLHLFQSGYVGGWTPDEAPPPEIVVEELRFGPPVRWTAQEPSMRSPYSTAGPTDLQRIVATTREAFRLTGLALPRKPWRKELADVYDLELDLRHDTDAEIRFAMLDDPENQDQYAATFVPDRDGNMAIFGTGGSGKTTVLRTLAVAAGLAPGGGPCHVYGIDFGGRGLQLIEPLPTVGAIVAGDDHERLTRLLRFVRDLIDERLVRYARVKAGSIVEYRHLTESNDEPRVLLLIDGMASFRTVYDTGDRLRWLEMLNGIASDGRQAGVHVIVTADRMTTIPAALASAIQRRLVLRLASEQEYAMVDVAHDVLSNTSPPGRGIFDGAEVQVAVVGGDANIRVQSRAIERIASEEPRPTEWSMPKSIGRLPERIGLSELPVDVDGLPAFGIADDTLEPIGFSAHGALLVTGPPASGVTTVMATLAMSHRRARPGGRLVYMGQRRSPLWTLPVWHQRANGVDEIAELADRVASELTNETANESASGSMLVVIERIADYLDSPADYALLSMVKACIAHDVAVVCDIEPSSALSYAPVLQVLRSSRHGIALQPEQHDGEQVFKTPFPRVSRAEFPPGRGFYVRLGRATRVQCALPDIDSIDA
jgi:S-DNA-T family DNA segregation ATPase FtsK/SpoIIIE